MTLNASGPLSLGGSTTGQSINLELGQSATALASINSTAFRTLAGVASGQISISSFYGKSNSIGWVMWLGNSPAVAGYYDQANPFYVDGESNVYWMFQQTNTGHFGLAKATSDAVISTYIFPFTGSPAYLNVGSTRSSSAYVSVGYGAAGVTPMLYGSSLTRLYPGTLQAQLGNLYNPLGNRAGAITSDGQFVFSGLESYDGYNGLASIIKYNAAGTSAVQYRFPSENSTSKVLLRTDGSIILFTKLLNNVIIRTFSSALVPTNNYYNPSATGQSSINFDACIGSSNEIFLISIENGAGDSDVTRYDSSYVATHRVRLNATVVGSSLRGIATYGSFVYVTSNSPTDIYVTCLLASDLSIQWTNKFTWGGAGNPAAVSLYATANGLFFGMIVFSSNYMFLKIPLTGMPSASSVAVSGAGASISWTIPTFTVTSQSVGATSTSTQTPTARTPAATSVPAAGSSVVPTLTKTNIA